LGIFATEMAVMDGAMLKLLLQELIVATNPGLPELWQNAWRADLPRPDERS
jgi:hypothetical protein